MPSTAAAVKAAEAEEEERPRHAAPPAVASASVVVGRHQRRAAFEFGMPGRRRSTGSVGRAVCGWKTARTVSGSSSLYPAARRSAVGWVISSAPEGRLSAGVQQLLSTPGHGEISGPPRQSDGITVTGVTAAGQGAAPEVGGGGRPRQVAASRQ